MTKPLVSILIPVYNAERWIRYTLESAIGQTWPRKEIIIVDDGSTDRTLELARRFVSREVKVISTENRGVSEAENLALQASQGDYIQYLDADDLLVPNKIERQLATLGSPDTKRLLLSSQWAPFYFRTRNACFVRNALCQDLTPVEWLLRKMSLNLHMQTSTWLSSRELIEAAGPWDTRLAFDHDGEFFCRVLMASEGTRFTAGTGVFYRTIGAGSVSNIGKSNAKKDSLLVSMKLHMQYLRSLEDSERVRKACLTYMQTWFHSFYPDRPDILAELQGLAVQLQGRLDEPRLHWKYAWMKPVFGWKAAEWAQKTLPEMKSKLVRKWDEAMFKLEARDESARHAIYDRRGTEV